MDIAQIIKKIKTASAAPYYEMLESDQTLPAGMYRWRIQNDIAILERALAVDWSSVREVLAITSAGIVTVLDVLIASEIRLTPKASSSGAEGTMFYDSDDDHVYVATE